MDAELLRFQTNKKKKIKQFIFDNCIGGITFEV